MRIMYACSDIHCNFSCTAVSDNIIHKTSAVLTKKFFVHSNLQIDNINISIDQQTITLSFLKAPHHLKIISLNNASLCVDYS